jgi:hypothetical protein
MGMPVNVTSCASAFVQSSHQAELNKLASFAGQKLNKVTMKEGWPLIPISLVAPQLTVNSYP